MQAGSELSGGLGLIGALEHRPRDKPMGQKRKEQGHEKGHCWGEENQAERKFVGKVSEAQYKK